MKTIDILTDICADSDGAWADGGHVAHCGALVATAAPPRVGAGSAVLQVNQGIVILVKTVFCSVEIKYTTQSIWDVAVKMNNTSVFHDSFP